MMSTVEINFTIRQSQEKKFKYDKNRAKSHIKKIIKINRCKWPFIKFTFLIKFITIQKYKTNIFPIFK